MPMPSKLTKNYLAAHLKVASGIVPICGQNVEEGVSFLIVFI